MAVSCRAAWLCWQDAGHMLTDAASIALALVAVWIAGRPESIERTFGYQRTEVLAAAFNALSLWVIAGWIVWEAIERMFSHHEIHIEGGLMLIVGGIGPGRQHSGRFRAARRFEAQPQ